MLIPVRPESAEDFIARATAVLADAGSHVYVDTSFAMWLTSIGSRSRAAFLDWATGLGERLHAPTWTLQEYFRHHQSGTQVRGINKKCLAVEKALEDLAGHMRVYADGQLVPARPEMAFMRELATATDAIKDATKLARAWNYDVGATEVIDWLNGIAMDSTTTLAGFEALRQRGAARYSHEVPPGFEDRHKRKNRYGDLLFWDDVIADARERTATTAVVLTRDRKKDWYFSNLGGAVSEDLKRLKGSWEAVPVPHPLLAMEMKAAARADLLLIDELYLGAVMWSADKKRFGRLAAVTFGMTLERLAAETAPPPKVATRAIKRDSQDVVSMGAALSLIASAKAATTPPAQAVLAGLDEEAPAAEALIVEFTPDRIKDMAVADLAALSRLLYANSLVGSDGASVLAEKLLDSIDKVPALAASAILAGMLVEAYFDGPAARDRPVGPLLQRVFEWRTDPGASRLLDMLGRDLKKGRSPAIYLPNSEVAEIEVRIEASEAVDTVPITVGQIYLGPQAVLVETAIEEDLSLLHVAGKKTKLTVEELVEAVGLHFGVPLDLLAVSTAAADEMRAISADTGVDRFDPYRMPARTGEEPSPAEDGGEGAAGADAAAVPLEAGRVANAQEIDDQIDDDRVDDEDEEDEDAE